MPTDEIPSYRFWLAEQANIRAKEAIQQEEDQNIFAALTAAGDPWGALTSTVSTSTLMEELDIDYDAELERMREELESVAPADLRTYTMPTGPRFIEDSFVVTPAVTISREAVADLYNVHGIDASSMVEPATAVGAFPIRQDITVLPADDPARLRIGWRIYEDVGIAFINDYAISNITFGDDPIVDEEPVYTPTLRDGILTSHTHRYPFGRRLDLGEDII